MLLPVQNKKVEMRDKKFSRGIALVAVVLILGLLAGSANAATIEEEIWVSPDNSYFFEFTVEEPGTIYAEAKLEEQIEELFLSLEFLSTGEKEKKKVWGKSGELLTLSYDVSERDLEVGTRWKISVGSGAGAGSGYIKIDYPGDTTPPAIIGTAPTGENVPVATEITISFSEQMDTESVISAFSIYPEVAGEFDWDDNTMIFMPSSNLSYDTGYVVELEGAKDLAGNDLNYYNWDFETVSPPELIPPTAYINIYPNPATEGEEVTFEGYGEDEDGEVVECRWTLPDGRTFSESRSSSWFTLEPEEVVAGWYSFAVRDDDGAWSEEVGLYLELEASPPLPWTWILAATTLAIAAVLIIRKAIKRGKEENGRDKNGLIHADSNPQNALTLLDEVYCGLSPTTVPEVSVGGHTVTFKKFGYFDCNKEAVVNANQTTQVHCDLTELPEIKLKLTADGKSKSIITIGIEDNNGIPIPVPEDVTVDLATDSGTIERAVKIPAGHASAKATLTSSTVKGTATVAAKVKSLKGSTAVEFLRAT